eukprot:TRINITY_DN2797_c0_g1_i1.p1 TRINITY_DN2797_c0_g1~~TRINITY_DN2797_c0_g1_i1.p1  ORF type:complete len:176 (-),score=48.53 TRINITY_DN2797_c0_g1_i1:131-658(-)
MDESEKDELLILLQEGVIDRLEFKILDHPKNAELLSKGESIYLGPYDPEEKKGITKDRGRSSTIKASASEISVFKEKEKSESQPVPRKSYSFNKYEPAPASSSQSQVYKLRSSQGGEKEKAKVVSSSPTLPTSSASSNQPPSMKTVITAIKSGNNSVVLEEFDKGLPINELSDVS